MFMKLSLPIRKLPSFGLFYYRISHCGVVGQVWNTYGSLCNCKSGAVNFEQDLVPVELHYTRWETTLPLFI